MKINIFYNKKPCLQWLITVVFLSNMSGIFFNISDATLYIFHLAFFHLTLYHEYFCMSLRTHKYSALMKK